MCCTAHRGTKRVCDHLVTQTHAEDWNACTNLAHHLCRQRAVGWRARSRRQHDSLRGKRLDPGNRDRVVAHHVSVRAQLRSIAGERMHERVAMVKQQYHDASASAASSAAALSSVSWYSCPGSESAVIPPPAPRLATPSVTVTVRIAMLRSAPPSSPIQPIAPQ